MASAIVGRPIMSCQRSTGTWLVMRIEPVEGAGEPAHADAARAGDDEIPLVPDPVATGELEEERAVETAGGAIIDILDACRLPQAGDP